MKEIKFIETNNFKTKPQEEALGFGRFFTDHMFVMDYEKTKGWHSPQIVPYGKMELEPSTSVLHYGQAVFEGLKAYRGHENKILLFRPEENLKRFNLSNDRMGMPLIDVDFSLKAIVELVKKDKSWLPLSPKNSLYIRPFMFATDPYLGVAASNTYKFMVIMSPVSSYYEQGISPVNIYVEKNYVRSVKGGTGNIKTSGNYAASIKAQIEANKNGYNQVLWLDGVHRKYIEEVGSMNIFFMIGNKFFTPSLEGSILAGITRDSVITLLKSWGYEVIEKRITIQEIYKAYSKKELKESFGTGTAVVISPIGELMWENKKIIINNKEVGPITQKIYDTIIQIQTGKIEDKFNWTYEI